MNKIQISLFLAGILAVAGLTYGIMASNKGELSEFIVPVSKQFVYYDEILIDVLQQKLMTLSQLQQFDLLNQFVKEGHKFFSPNQILKIFQVMYSDEGRSYAVNIIKPYIPAISVDEFLQILPFVLTDYISSSIFIGQIYNLSEDTAKLIAQKYLQPQYAFKNLLQPQLVKYFNSGFLLTQEGQHIAFLIDSSNSMKTVGFIRDGKDQLTRQNLLQQFYYEARYNLFNNFFTFSFARVQPCQYGAYSNNNFIDHYEQIKYLNSVVNNYPADGETDLYSGMATLLANSNDRLSDVYILSDGIVTQNTNKLEDFISYIDFQNSRRKNKIRINTISFLLGGDEPQSVRDEATALLQGLADHTNGTFIQYVPY